MDPTFFLNRSDDRCNRSAHASFTAATTSYLLCFFVGCLSVLIMSGNSVVIISIAYFKQLHTPTNYLILSLAVADLLVGVLVLPFSLMLAVFSCWRHEDLLCKVRATFDMFLCTSSILNLCCISVDRYYAVCQPLRYRSKINVHVIVVMILVSWTASALIGLLGLNQRQSDRCVFFMQTRASVTGSVFAFYLPAVVMFTIYMKIFLVAQRQARSILSTSCQSAKLERKATRTLAIVMGVFLLCWTPFFFGISVYLLGRYTVPIPVIESFKWLAWSNSMLNPFVYGFFYTWFRSALRMIVSGKIFQGDFTNSKLF